MAFVRQNFMYNYKIGESQAVNWKTNSDHVEFRTGIQQQWNYPSQRNISWGLSSILVLVHSRRSLTSPTCTGILPGNTVKPGDSTRTELWPSKTRGQHKDLTLKTIWDRGPWLLFNGNLAVFPCPARGAAAQKWHKTASSNTLQNSLQK